MQLTAQAVGTQKNGRSPNRAKDTPSCAYGATFCRRFGVLLLFTTTHGWRLGLQSSAASRLSSNLGDSSTRFPGHKKRPGRNSNSLLETHGHDRRTCVTQPEIFKTTGRLFALRVRNTTARIVPVAAGFETKQFALMKVKERSRAARIGALRKHFAVP